MTVSEPKSQFVRGYIQKFVDRCWPGESDRVTKLWNSLMNLRIIIAEDRNAIKNCPVCDQLIDDVKTSYSIHTAVDVLYKLVQWCRANGRHEFDVAEVKGFLDHTQYANVNHLDRFAGIVYRPMNPETSEPYKGKFFGINLQRADEFFRNERAAPVQIVTNRLTGERVAVTQKYLKDFPQFQEFLDDRGAYDPDRIIPDAGSVQYQSLPTVPELLT